MSAYQAGLVDGFLLGAVFGIGASFSAYCFWRVYRASFPDGGHDERALDGQRRESYELIGYEMRAGANRCIEIEAMDDFGEPSGWTVLKLDFAEYHGWKADDLRRVADLLDTIPLDPSTPSSGADKK